MGRRWNAVRRWTCRLAVLGSLMLLSLTLVQGAAAADVFDELRRRLVADGFDAATLARIYAHPDVAFETRGVSLYFVHREGKLDYAQFLDPDQIQNARIYLNRHRDLFAAAERDFGVTRFVIAGILLVETRLGAFVGTRSVLNSLSTMAALGHDSARDRLWNDLIGVTNLSRAEFEQKALNKAGWAYDELMAFLRYAIGEGIEPVTVKGSYAGAMGFCQFMPSNIVKFAKDGDGDGRIDLFTHADAIASIASYLLQHGWHPGLSDGEAYNVVYTYNHSNPYVTTVLQIASLLKG